MADKPVTLLLRVAGVSFRQVAVARAQPGDAIELVPDPGNQHDPNAIKVMLARPGRQSMQLGFIAREDNELILETLAAGGSVVGSVDGTGIPKGSNHRGVTIKLEIWLPHED